MIEGLQGIVAPPAHAIPLEPLAPGGDVAKIVFMNFGKLERESFLRKGWRTFGLCCLVGRDLLLEIGRQGIIHGAPPWGSAGPLRRRLSPSAPTLSLSKDDAGHSSASSA